jgi:hypothetical protein
MNETRLRSLLAGSLAVLLLLAFTGCSTNDANPVSSNGTQSEASQTPQASIYPIITVGNLPSLIPGMEVLQTNGRSGADPLDDQTSRFIRYQIGGTVTHHNNGVEIPAWVLRSDQTVTVSTPVPGAAIVDYFPHPYSFNGCVRIWIDLRTIQLPAGRRWDEVQFWYQEADGTLTRYWGVIDLIGMTYSAWPNHFSRYILALPTR